MARKKRNGKRTNGVQFRRYFTSRGGRKIDAHDYGHRYWPIGRGK